MSLRTRLFIFLFAFALLPLLTAVLINLPLILERVEIFYRQAFLQNLRADFADLDTHLASRDEMIRLLAKLPEPGLVLGQDMDQRQIDLARLQYIDWINRILKDQLDILNIVFLDQDGIPRFWLARDPQTHLWEPVAQAPKLPEKKYLQAVLSSTTPTVILTPVSIDEQAQPRSISLQMLSPLGPFEQKPTYGAVLMTVDIGGLIRRDAQTLWVHDDGRYLSAPDGLGRHAFEQFPGLQAQFAKKSIFLWSGADDQTLIWVPLLRTEEDKPLWVARFVRNEPLLALRNTLVVRVLAIIFALIIVIALLARWVSNRLEKYGTELLEGIEQVLTRAQPVQFNWQGSPELQELGRNLSRLSYEHVHNLQQLKAHAQALEESNRYQSEFLSNVSHELRTPLNSIVLLSKLLVEEDLSCLDEEQRQKLQVIYQASLDLKRLIDNILDLSKIEAGKLSLNIETVDLHQLLHEIQELMQPQFEIKALQLKIQIDPNSLRYIQTDADQLSQILKNFLSNALKFTSEGEVILGLSPASAPYAVRLWVRDTGIGIAPDKQELIFEAFRQADGSTHRRYGGTGLGLSISKQLAQLLGGQINLKSQLGQGSEFSILLPAACGKIKPIIKKKKTVKIKQEAPKPLEAQFKGRKILLLESDIDRLLHWSHLLESWQIEVRAAGDKEELLETLAEEKIDLILATQPLLVAASELDQLSTPWLLCDADDDARLKQRLEEHWEK